MEPSHEVKPPRRPWTARELGLLLAVVALAGALWWERTARLQGDRETRDGASDANTLTTKTINERDILDLKWKLDAEKKLDEMKSRVIDLENVNRDRKEGR